jgi:23S rRNA (cytosine1962-C5)-methyltransferase
LIKVIEIDMIGNMHKICNSSWLFSNQVQHISDKHLNEQKISLVNIKGTKKIGIYSKQSLISIRFLPDKLYDFIENKVIKKEVFINELGLHLNYLKQAKVKFQFPQRESYRLSHGDNDGLPAIAIDDYQSVLVLQSSSLIGEFLLPYIIDALKIIDNRPLFERSTGQIRKLENLPERTRWIREPDNQSNNFEISCNFTNLKLTFFLNKAQKTGLFLDQRKNIEYLSSILRNYNINSCLDICSYAGAWSATAAASGVKNLTLIDQDSWALNLAKRNILANTNNNVTIETLHGDMFEHMQILIKNNNKFDLIILDPPAFAKSKKHISEAMRAYSRITKLASKLLADNGILIVCSCSRHIKEQEFLESVAYGLNDGKWVFLHKGEQSPCHTHLANPDSSEYLKCYFLNNRVLSSC